MLQRNILKEAPCLHISWRILCIKRRILQSPMPNEHPDIIFTTCTRMDLIPWLICIEKDIRQCKSRASYVVG